MTTLEGAIYNMGIIIVPQERQDSARRESLQDTLLLNEEPTGIAGLYKKLPTNFRLLLENLVGVEEPVTEKDFTDSELIQMVLNIEDQKKKNNAEENRLRQQKSDSYSFASVSDNASDPRIAEEVKSFEDTRGKTSINPYGESPRGMVDQNYIDALLKSFSNTPSGDDYRIATSLGRYNAVDKKVDSPESFQYTINDTYDFNKKERDLPTGFKEVLNRFLSSPEIAGEYVANLVNTDPRPVKINLRTKSLEQKANGGFVDKPLYDNPRGGYI